MKLILPTILLQFSSPLTFLDTFWYVISSSVSLQKHRSSQHCPQPLQQLVLTPRPPPHFFWPQQHACDRDVLDSRAPAGAELLAPKPCLQHAETDAVSCRKRCVGARAHQGRRQLFCTCCLALRCHPSPRPQPPFKGSGDAYLIPLSSSALFCSVNGWATLPLREHYVSCDMLCIL